MALVPLFPLELVLFPKAALPLHVFEPQYRALLRHCLLHQEPFGVLAIRQGAEVGGQAASFGVGTLAHIEEVSRLPDGRSDVLARGGERFRVRRRVAGAPYPRAEVEALGDLPSAWYASSVVGDLRRAYRAYRRSVRGLGLEVPLFEELPQDPESLSWAIADHLLVELSARQELLEERRPLVRIRRELSLLRREATFVDLGLANRLIRPPRYTVN